MIHTPSYRKLDTLDFPCLFMDKQEWESLVDKLSDPFFAQLHQDNLNSLLELEASPLQAHSRRLKNSLQRTVVAWYITHEQRYLDMAFAALWVCCEHTELWWYRGEYVEGLRAADLSTGEMLYNVAFAYDALFPYLPDELKRACETVLIEQGLAAYLKGVELRDWWVDCDFNWNSALHGNAGLAALVIRHVDEDLSNRVLAEVLRGLPYMVKSFYPDGGYIEGVMYFNTAIGHLTDFVVPYMRLTGNDLDLLSNQAIADTITWRLYMWGGDGKVLNFSDVSEYVGQLGLPQLYWWAQQLNHPEWTGDNDQRVASSRGSTGLFHDVESFWYRDAHSPTRQPDIKKLRHFEGIDWLTWHGEHTWLAFRSGFNGGNHDNDDLGTFILGYDEERFLCDPGYRVNNASEHNCITVREFEQTDCATARVTRIEEMDNGFYLCCDITEAFPLALEHYERHLLLIDEVHVLMIDDVLCHPAYRTWARSYLQTRLPVQATEKGWRVQGEKHKMDVLLLSDTGFHKLDAWSFSRNRGDEINRMSWRDAYDREHTVQVTLLTFGTPEIASTINEGGVKVQVDGKVYHFKTSEKRLVLQQG